MHENSILQSGINYFQFQLFSMAINNVNNRTICWPYMSIYPIPLYGINDVFCTI